MEVETQEQTTVDTSAPVEQTSEAPVKEVTTAEAIQANAEKALASRETPESKAQATAAAPPEVKKGPDGKVITPDPAAAAKFTPNLKYKVMDKEHEIPKEFEALMKDADSEKKIREIFEKSTGLDVVKQNLTEARNERDKTRREYAELNGSITDLRSTFQDAVNSGDLLRLDAFWKKLDISQDTIMKYALEKVKLHEMPAEQRSAVLSAQQERERATAVSRQQAEMSRGYIELRQQTKQLQLDHALTRPENVNAASDLSIKLGRPDAFKEEVRRFGEYEWQRSNGTVDLSPEQAIAAVIKHYNLRTEAQAEVVTPTTPQANKDPRQNVIVKPVGVIPNLGGGGSQSPLKSKPKSIEDLKKLSAAANAGEAV